MKTRADGRPFDQLRPIDFQLEVQQNPEGSVLYRSGGTTMLIAASVDEGVPDFRGGQGAGWLTAEYMMHPRANPRRQPRESRRGRPDGRSQEIQRLIGRALRAAVHFDRLGERTITVDCDVLDADGGTRTAAITGGFVALALAVESLRRRGLVDSGVLRSPIAAISVGLVDGWPMLDLCYTEDRDASVDLNVVGSGGGELVEVQGTAEEAPVSRGRFDAMLDLALGAIPRLVEGQLGALGRAGVAPDSLIESLQ